MAEALPAALSLWAGRRVAVDDERVAVDNERVAVDNERVAVDNTGKTSRPCG